MTTPGHETIWASGAERFRDHYGMFVGGADVEAANDRRFELYSPVDGSVLCSVADASERDVWRAVRRAQEVFNVGDWSQRAPSERARVLRRIGANVAEAVPKLAEIDALSIGRPVRELRAQLARFWEWFEYYGALAETIEGFVPPVAAGFLNYITRRPIGVAGLITPWNHPLAIAIKKIAPALAGGNSVVVKPSEFAPISVLELARLATDAGLPAGVINVVTGVGPVAGRALAEHPGLARVDFTGGTDTGRAVASSAGGNLVPVTTELGGKAPVLIFDDVDARDAVAGASFAAFIGGGQTCVQGSRLLIQASMYDTVLAGLVERANALRIGHPLDLSTQFACVASEGQLDRISAAVTRAREEGATVACGGEPLSAPPFDRGYWYPPTVLSDVTPDMACFQEEIFGPVVAALRFDDEEDAERLANDCRFGLAASIWTNDIGRAHRLAEALDVGMVWINTHHRTDPASPWGGTKDSGIGREQGKQAYYLYTQTKSVFVKTAAERFDWYSDGDNQRLN